MQWLYSTLLAASFSAPFLLSFDKKIAFYKHWKYLFPSIVTVALFYIVSDIYFTAQGIWGFNPEYHFRLKISGLPLEEILFFIVIPYACAFIHETLRGYFPNLQLSKKQTLYLSFIFIAAATLLSILFFDRMYTVYNYSLLVLSLILGLLDKSGELSRFYISFIVMLIPFVIVNGILTGTFIENEVVWYNNSETLNFRIFTIPLEDFGYAFSLIFLNILLMTKLKQRFSKSPKQ